MEIEQGGIFGHDFGPRRNHLQEGPRPVVVVQIDALNSLAGYSNVVIIPLTTKQKPSTTYVQVSPSANNALTAPSWAIANQIFTIDKGDLARSMGKVSKQELYLIKQAIMFVVGAKLS